MDELDRALERLDEAWAELQRVRANSTLATRFRQKRVEVDAVRVTGSADGEAGRAVAKWCNGLFGGSFEEPTIIFSTPDGEIRAEAGDWIVKDANGEFRRCAPGVFEATYEAIGGHDSPMVNVYAQGGIVERQISEAMKAQMRRDLGWPA